MRLGGAVSEYNSYNLLRCADARDEQRKMLGNQPRQQAKEVAAKIGGFILLSCI